MNRNNQEYLSMVLIVFTSAIMYFVAVVYLDSAYHTIYALTFLPMAIYSLIKGINIDFFDKDNLFVNEVNDK